MTKGSATLRNRSTRCREEDGAAGLAAEGRVRLARPLAARGETHAEAGRWLLSAKTMQG